MESTTNFVKPTKNIILSLALITVQILPIILLVIFAKMWIFGKGIDTIVPAFLTFFLSFGILVFVTITQLPIFLKKHGFSTGKQILTIIIAIIALLIILPLVFNALIMDC